MKTLRSYFEYIVHYLKTFNYVYITITIAGILALFVLTIAYVCDIVIDGAIGEYVETSVITISSGISLGSVGYISRIAVRGMNNIRSSYKCYTNSTVENPKIGEHDIDIKDLKSRVRDLIPHILTSVIFTFILVGTIKILQISDLIDIGLLFETDGDKISPIISGPISVAFGFYEVNLAIIIISLPITIVSYVLLVNLHKFLVFNFYERPTKSTALFFGCLTLNMIIALRILYQF